MRDEEQTQPWTLSVLLALRLLALGTAAALFLLSFGSRARAEEAVPVLAQGNAQRQLIPMGRAVGIKLFSDGVMVVGLAEVPSSDGASTPAKDCGLRQGDIITHINDTQVDTIEQVRDVLQDLEGDKMSIRAMRGEKQVQFTAQAVACSDGSYRLGAWIRDSMAGIGTMSFYDPDTGLFGALGHGINDVDTALLMPLESGSIMYASVSDVKKGEAGQPGELHGAFQVSQDMGDLLANTPGGIFGTLTDQSLVDGLEPMPVAARKEVKVGSATILSNIAGNTVEEYTVEITKVFPSGSHDTRDPDDQGYGPPSAGGHRRHRPGDERQPHSAKRKADRRGDPCACERPHKRLWHTGRTHAGRIRPSNRDKGVITLLPVPTAF